MLYPCYTWPVLTVDVQSWEEIGCAMLLRTQVVAPNETGKGRVPR